MKTQFYLVAKTLSLIALSFAAVAQPTLHNPEAFTIGTVLRFADCHTTAVQPGIGGANVYWDFSNLVPSGDTLTQWMLAPSATSYGALFPAANLVEKFSDGRFVFANVTGNQNYLVGFVDSVQNLTITYPNPALFMQRPISYNDVFTDDFTAHTTGPGFAMNGTGSFTVSADGYGTLALPNGIYNDVLRVNVTFTQIDTLAGLGFVSTTISETFAWFDAAHTSALLKIDTTYSTTGFTQKKVAFLIDEVVSGVKTVDQPSVEFSASMTDERLMLFGTFDPTQSWEASVYDAAGKLVSVTPLRHDGKMLDGVVGPLANGVYLVALKLNGLVIGTARVACVR